MAIPASVTLYINWVHGVLSSGTYTMATPEVPNAFTQSFTGDESIVVDNDAPWSGQSVMWLDGSPTVTYGDSTVSSSTIPTTAGRLLIEFEELVARDRTYFLMQHNADFNKGRLYMNKTSGNCSVTFLWDSGQTATASVTWPATAAFTLEIIYDAANATAANRLRIRTYEVGGTAGSFTDTASSTSSGTTNEFTRLILGANGDNHEIQIGRIIVSNDITEDLSAVTEGGGVVVPAIVHHMKMQGFQ